LGGRNQVNNQNLQFDQLSGGTREQVSAAFRLAMAEVLASDHEGCLPVVFDDAFANSDSDRVKAIHDMLYHASTEGRLQLIVLSCSPQDYQQLGAGVTTVLG